MALLSKIKQRINAYKGITPSVVALHESVNKYLPDNPVIIEAGAHMGFDTVGLAKIWPKGFVYGFEPVPDIFSELKSRVQSLSNVKTYKLALGERSAMISMYVSSGMSNASSSILKPSKHLELFPQVAFDSSISVEMTTLQEWASKENVPAIDLMWLDMQGYEVNALKGAADLLHNVSVIYTELCESELYTGLVTRNDYIKFLKDVGFEPVLLTHDEEVSDGIFVNNSAIQKR